MVEVSILFPLVNDSDVDGTTLFFTVMKQLKENVLKPQIPSAILYM